MNFTNRIQPSADSVACTGRWHKSMEAASFQGRGVEFWDSWVRSLPQKREHSGYIEEVLKRLKLEPDYSVLDVGAGTGALTIPVAGRVRCVTALDHSSEMLATVERNARENRLSNVRLLHLDWTRAELGEGLEPHDVVLVSRSLPAGNDILRCLDLIDRAALRSCFITWKADSHDAFEEGLCGVLGVEYHPFPNHAVLCDIIRSMGIKPDIAEFETFGNRIYESLEQARTQILRSHVVSDAAMSAKVTQYLAHNLDFRDGRYLQEKRTRWALISWHKD